MWQGKLQPKLQLMIYLGVSARSEHNYLFMCPNNTLHTSAHAIFNEHLFPKYSGAWPHKPVSYAPHKPHKDAPNRHESDLEVIDNDVALQDPLTDHNPWYNHQCESLRQYHHNAASSFTHSSHPPCSHPPPIGPPPLRRGEWEHCAPFHLGNIYGEHG
jgi:hypothetical protein